MIYPSSVPSYSSVIPVHVAEDEAAVIPTPIANPPASTFIDPVGSAAVELKLSYGVALERPVAEYKPRVARTIGSLKVTTTSPDVPVGTAAIAIQEILQCEAVFICSSTIVAVTPPIVTPDILVAPPDFLAVTQAIM